MQFRQEFSARAAKNAHIKVGTFLRIFAQLLLIMEATYVFSIEERVAFVDYFGILLPVAFLVHAWLPLKFRLPFFVFTTVGVILWIFGATSGMWFLLIGLSLIGICHW